VYWQPTCFRRAAGDDLVSPLVGAVLAAEQRKPSELARYLGLLIEYAHEVPDPFIASELRAYSAGKGTSKSQVEVGRLVAVLTR
jgi:hypothetical protein